MLTSEEKHFKKASQDIYNMQSISYSTGQKCPTCANESFIKETEQRSMKNIFSVKCTYGVKTEI